MPQSANAVPDPLTPIATTDQVATDGVADPATPVGTEEAVERAADMLMRGYGLDRTEAHAVLSRLSHETDTDPRVVAETVVATVLERSRAHDATSVASDHARRG